ncbi:hypothetical protein [Costertonia aggregata]|uniref:Uncharacterized protein n=1 Tax=Costertonia aggregata TaxID=343403 RepID=A0A7H9APP8_9FLAO|nr:hypothetical protein [Costertonia aggregata]QLG45438.1 hypothetical protein HYG79_08800 [Costertonia aggregata]
MKRLHYLFSILCFALLNVSSSCSKDKANEMGEISQESGDENQNPSASGKFELVAKADYLSNNGSGEQAWGDNVTIEAFKINGDAGEVVFETQFKDDGFGVAGGRWKQIDYYYEYQGEIVKSSEALVFTFKRPAAEVTLQVGQMDPGEGQQAKEGKTCEEGGSKNKVDESGKWTAYDENNNIIGSGILLDEYSIEGKLPNSMGSYRFLLDTGNQKITKLVIEATQWGGEERGCPTQRGSYANQPLNDSGNTENNSEFNVMGLSFTL